MSPKMWQLEHDASPLLEVSVRVVEERPSVDDARRLRIVQREVRGLGRRVARSTTETALSKRVST